MDACNELKTGSIDAKIVPQSPLATMGSVMAAMMQMVDSARISFSA